MYHVVGNHMSLLNYREGGVVSTFLRSHQRILQRAVQTAHEKQLDPFLRGGGSVPVFLREPLATCGFPDGGGGGGHPAPHSGVVHALSMISCYYE